MRPYGNPGRMTWPEENWCKASRARAKREAALVIEEHLEVIEEHLDDHNLAPMGTLRSDVGPFGGPGLAKRSIRILQFDSERPLLRP